MGPFQYKTVFVSIGIFGKAEDGVKKIQEEIDEHVKDGWELFQYQPVHTLLVWEWNILIFRRPTE